MAKRTRGKKANATRPRRDRRDRSGREPGPVATPPEPNPLEEIADALSEDHPLSLLMVASSVLASLDPPTRSPFDSEEPVDQPTLDELVTTFLEVDRPETRALLAAIATLVDDDVMRRRIDRELASRPSTHPRWLSGLRAASGADSAFETVHVLGDADNLVVGLRVPPEHDVAVMLLVDHNLGTVVKDAFAAAMSPSDLAREAHTTAGDPDVTVNVLDPADARARLEDAIRTGSMVFPPLQSDSWPAARPLVEWVLRLQPAGGSVDERPEWDDDSLAEVTERFFASRFGVELDDPDRRSLLGSLLWFGTDYGPGDPLRWSPQSVEIVLADWIPRKIVADAGYLASAPALLRAWVRFCHAERGIRETLTAETLAVVDELEPEYQRTIRSPRPQGPAALLAAMGMTGDWTDEVIGAGVVETVMLEMLQAAVGGEAALEHLSTDPLPDETFDETAIPGDLRERSGEILALVDRCCDELLDVEYRTACRRLLARVAGRDQERLRRGRADTLAAATCWVIGKANRLFDGTMTAKELTAHFGLAPNSVAQRGKAMLTGLGIASDGYDIDLGAPELLTSTRRAQIAADRDRFRATMAALDP